MKKYAFLCLIVVLTFVSCETDSDEESNSFQLPESISGCIININVGEIGGSSVASGLTIRYTFNAPNEQVSGINPESQITYTAQSYTYVYSDNSGTITLNYGQGAYEEYFLQPTSESGGIYTSESFDGVNSANSTGTYDFSCF